MLSPVTAVHAVGVQHAVLCTQQSASPTLAGCLALLRSELPLSEQTQLALT